MEATRRRRADTAARRAAQQGFGRPLLLEAGAGTGKTSVLVHRVVAWCLGPGWERAARALSGADDERVAARVLERLVAITFTDAAAAEMEARVAALLHGLAATGEPVPWPVGLERAALPGDATLRRTRARALLFGFDRLRVSTIHAFCRRLLAEHPLEAGVHPRFGVDAQGRARATVARAVVESWLFEVGRTDEPALAELVAAGVAAPQLEEMLIALLAAAVPAAEFAPDPLAPERIGAWVAGLRSAIQRLQTAEAGCLRALSGGNGQRVMRAVEETRWLLDDPAPADAERLEDWRAKLTAIWTDSERVRLREWGSGKWSSARESRAAGARGAAIEAASADLVPRLAHALALEPVRLARAHTVLVPLLARAERRLRNEGVESFDGLLRLARELLERHPEVADRVRAGIDQLLVDEFQDTDRDQCAIVARLGLEGAGPTRPGLFVVGDPKQSIYGWRNADLAAYEAFGDQLRQAGGAADELCVNHRSGPAVLDEVAALMAPIMRQEPGRQPAFQPLLAGNGAPAGGAPAVEYWISSDWDDTAGGLTSTSARDATAREARHLAHELARLARSGGAGWRWSDVGILLRTLSDADVYLETLRAENIPYAIARDRSYWRRREVVEAGALVCAVLDPCDQIALVATLRSAWVGVPDAAWRPLWAGGFPDLARRWTDGEQAARIRGSQLLGAVAEQLRGLDLPGLERLEGFEQGLAHALDVIAALRRSFATEPVARFVERLRTLTLFEAIESARFLGAWRLANLDRFFRDLLAALEEAGGAPEPVLRGLRRDASRDPAAWDDGRPQRPSQDAVQVATVHGAKGLEFEHVFLLQAHKGAARGVETGFRAGTGDDAGEWRLAAGGVELATLGFDAVARCRDAVAACEQVRTLYVAATRARQRLVIAGSWCGATSPASYVALLAPSRRAALDRALAALAVAGGSVADAEGVRFRVLAREPATEVGRSQARVSNRADPDPTPRAAADAARLTAMRVLAARRAARPFGAAPSAMHPERGREDVADAANAVGSRRDAAGAAAVAAAVGTAVHAFLERFDWEADPDREWERQRGILDAALVRSVAPGLRDAARLRASEVLEGIRRGGLWPRLCALAPYTIARELPILLPGNGGDERDAVGTEAPEQPVGYWAGSIDWVYRDPVNDDVVVVDFKTDRIAATADPAQAGQRYRAQVSLYAEAVRAALALADTPRLELWFLAASRVEIPGISDPLREVDVRS